MLFNVNMSNIVFNLGANDIYITYLYNVYNCIYKYIGIHKHDKQIYLNISTYACIIYNIIT